MEAGILLLASLGSVCRLRRFARMDGENEDLEKGAVDGPVKGNGYYTSDMHPIPSGPSSQSMSSVLRYTGDGDIETGSEFFNKLYRCCCHF